MEAVEMERMQNWEKLRLGCVQNWDELRWNHMQDQGLSKCLGGNGARKLSSLV